MPLPATLDVVFDKLDDALTADTIAFARDTRDDYDDWADEWRAIANFARSQGRGAAKFTDFADLLNKHARFLESRDHVAMVKGDERCHSEREEM